MKKETALKIAVAGGLAAWLCRFRIRKHAESKRSPLGPHYCPTCGAVRDDADGEYVGFTRPVYDRDTRSIERRAR